MRPGKRLALLVPGAIVALAALAGVIYIVYETWYLREFSEQRGYAFTTILADKQKTNAQMHASQTMRLGGLFDEMFNIKPLALVNGDTNGNGGPDHGAAA